MPSELDSVLTLLPEKKSKVILGRQPEAESPRLTEAAFSRALFLRKTKLRDPVAPRRKAAQAAPPNRTMWGLEAWGRPGNATAERQVPAPAHRR